jgi:hypothetical protein
MAAEIVSDRHLWKWVGCRERSSATFGPGEANQDNPDPVAVFKISSLPNTTPYGALVWAKRAGGTGYDQGFGIAVDMVGNCIRDRLFGGFSGGGAATFGFGRSQSNHI